MSLWWFSTVASVRGPSRSSRPGSLAAVRWLLLGALIAGVLAMHILSAADSAGSHSPMAMTSASTPSAASASMAMDIRADDSPVVATHPVGTTRPVSVGGAGMSPMSCCVLFLVPAVGLVLLMRFYRAGTMTTAAAGPGGPIAPSILRRGPPGPGLPRIALSILRV